MTTLDDVRQLIGCHVVDADGQRIGVVKQVFLDNSTHNPEFVTISDAARPCKKFVPLAGSQVLGCEVRVPYRKHMVDNAPSLDVDLDMTTAEQGRLCRHYGLGTGNEIWAGHAVGPAGPAF